MITPFVHLRAHTEYSLIDGLVQIPSLLDKLLDLGMPAVGITDLNNLFGIVKFYQACCAVGIKPIIGSDIYLYNEDNPKQPFLLTLLCQNKIGYQNLTCLLSKAYREGQIHDKPTVHKDWIMDLQAGLCMLSGAQQGDVGQALLDEQRQQASQCLGQWQQIFGNRFYLELQRVGRAQDEDYIAMAIDLAEKYSVPVIATNDIRYLNPEDYDAHEARVCIQEGFTLADPKRPRLYTSQQYLRSGQEMAELFADIPEALANTVELAKRCNLQLSLGKTYFPNFPIPKEATIGKILEEKSQKGLSWRLQSVSAFRQQKIEDFRSTYDERLQMELSLISSMGYSGYFLIVADFIAWARDQGIPVGPGRGSGAGSLVAYALGITDLDPLQYGLLFERFLNPERVSLPDFDIDFCINGRDRVIDYVASKYGRDSVAQIITFGTMAARAVVRDVGRVLGFPYGFVDRIAKLIPFELGITLEKALEQEEELKQQYQQEEEVAAIIDLAKKLEGITRNVGKHAGGIVIAPSLLTDFVPLYCEPGSSNIVSQFDKDDVETVGLVKFDFLGLKTLTIIDWAVKEINQERQLKGEPLLDISLLPTNDEATFELLKASQTTSVFQLESRGLKDLIKRLQPDCFEDIIALVALYRPGPLQSGMVDDFINRKHGRAAVEYLHPSLEWILKTTYGVILYQEQVMQISQVLAGYSLGGADLLRRAMGKKKAEEMAEQRDIFVKGAVARNVERSQAAYIFDLMEKFAGYGFNKSHSAVYALIAYQTAWLKAHYPAAYMAAVLSADMDNADKIAMLIDECSHLKLTIFPPDINRSEYQFKVLDSHTIIYGLGAIKGMGEAAILMLVQERQQNGHYSNLFSFCQRVDLKKINRRSLEALIRSGSMDSFKKERSVLMASLENALQAAEQFRHAKEFKQQDLFGNFENTSNEEELHYVEVIPWSETQRLLGEKETLGLYLTGHPLTVYREELQKIVKNSIRELRANTIATIAGLLMQVKRITTKRGDRMAVITLSDQTGKIDVTVFSDRYEQSKALLIKDTILIVEGEVSVDEFSGGLRLTANEVWDLPQVRMRHANHLSIRLMQNCIKQETLVKIQGILQAFRQGSCPVRIEYEQSQVSTTVHCGKEWQVLPSDELFETLKGVVGRDNVVLVY